MYSYTICIHCHHLTTDGKHRKILYLFDIILMCLTICIHTHHLTTDGTVHTICIILSICTASYQRKIIQHYFQKMRNHLYSYSRIVTIWLQMALFVRSVPSAPSYIRGESFSIIFYVSNYLCSYSRIVTIWLQMVHIVIYNHLCLDFQTVTICLPHDLLLGESINIS